MPVNNLKNSRFAGGKNLKANKSALFVSRPSNALCIDVECALEKKKNTKLE